MVYHCIGDDATTDILGGFLDYDLYIKYQRCHDRCCIQGILIYGTNKIVTRTNGTEKYNTYVEKTQTENVPVKRTILLRRMRSGMRRAARRRMHLTRWD